MIPINFGSKINLSILEYQIKRKFEKHYSKLFFKNFYIQIIDNILFYRKSHLSVLYEEDYIYKQDKEFLKKYYLFPETKIKLNKVLSLYEEFSQIYPNYLLLYEKKYLYDNIRRKQKVLDQIEYNKIKNNPNKNNFKNDSYSRILKSDTMNSIFRRTLTENNTIENIDESIENYEINNIIHYINKIENQKFITNELNDSSIENERNSFLVYNYKPPTIQIKRDKKYIDNSKFIKLNYLNEYKNNAQIGTKLNHDKKKTILSLKNFINKSTINNKNTIFSERKKSKENYLSSASNKHLFKNSFNKNLNQNTFQNIKYSNKKNNYLINNYIKIAKDIKTPRLKINTTISNENKNSRKHNISIKINLTQKNDITIKKIVFKRCNKKLSLSNIQNNMNSTNKKNNRSLNSKKSLFLKKNNLAKNNKKMIFNYSMVNSTKNNANKINLSNIQNNSSQKNKQPNNSLNLSLVKNLHSFILPTNTCFKSSSKNKKISDLKPIKNLNRETKFKNLYFIKNKIIVNNTNKMNKLNSKKIVTNKHFDSEFNRNKKKSEENKLINLISKKIRINDIIKNKSPRHLKFRNFKMIKCITKNSEQCVKSVKVINI